jgi:hypothetical protein
MFPYIDPQTQLDLHRQRVSEMIRDAAAYQRARTTGKGRHRRFGRWRDKEERGRPSRVTATA